MRRVLVSLLAIALPAGADEGLWPFNMIPTDALQSQYGFAPDHGWLERVRQASVRFNNGGSGSFIAPDGLVITNHHVGADCIQKLSLSGKDYVKDGFYAKSRDDELACPDLELNILMSIEDVTAKVNEKVRPGMAEAKVNRRQKAAMSRIEKECTEKTGYRCDVVTLYRGMEFHLYRYRKIVDVRLVFAPELDIAFFGGDRDNFTYPRFSLDFAFFRAFHEGKPLRVRHWLPFFERGPSAGDIVFVSGHPGTTGRLLTLSQLELRRETIYPFLLGELQAKLGALQAFAGRDEESARIAKAAILGTENSIKAITGFQRGLNDEYLMRRKTADELTLRSRVAVDPAMSNEYGDPWSTIAEVQKAYAKFYKRHAMLERARGLDSDLFSKARGLLRMADESKVKNERRLREYRESNLESMKLRLFSAAPIYPAYEEARLAHSLSRLSRVLGRNKKIVKQVLGGRTPEEAARAYVTGSKLRDPDFRRSLKRPRRSKDSMIRLARLVDKEARKLRKRYEDEVEGIEKVEATKIARVLFRTEGTTRYPDATFTLRLAYGPVTGYEEEDGKKIAPFTDIQGLLQRATGRDPYRLPPRWEKSKQKLDPKVKLNFVSTADIHGGNSGSPVVDRVGRFVGIVFDSNIHGLPNRFVYSDERARAVAVHSEAILHSLRTVYEAKGLVAEIEKGAK